MPKLTHAALLALICVSFSVARSAAPAQWDSVPRTVRSPSPDLVLTGAVTDADDKTTRHVPFQVPEGVVRLGIEVDYTGHDRGTVIDTGVYGPDGFRGWSGSSKRSVV